MVGMGKGFAARILSVGLCLAVGGSTLFSAQDARTRSKTAPRKSRVTKTTSVAEKKAPAAPTGKAAFRKGGAALRHKAAGGAPLVDVTGTITDGSGHGWPLYARVEFTSKSTTPVVVFTDPVTGAYQTQLTDGVEYTQNVTAVSKGYEDDRNTVTTAGSPVVADAALEVEVLTCQAPGYSGGFEPILTESFDAGVLPKGWSIDTASGASWTIFEGADPCGQFPGNQTGGSGPYAILNSNCDSDLENTDDSSLITPAVDLSEVPAAAIRWNNDYIDLFSTADVDVSTDGGKTWTNVWQRQNVDEAGPGVQVADITEAAAGQAEVLARFHFVGFFAWWWQVDNVEIGEPTCTPVAGGLVVGNVLDANTDGGINGATVTNTGDASSTTTFATPEDPNQEDGFYILFSPSGDQTLEATATAYSSDSHTVPVVADDAVRQDFVLQAGRLEAAPRPLEAVIPPDTQQDQTLTLTNSGALDVNFQINEINAPLLPNNTVGFADPGKRQAALNRLPGNAKSAARAARSSEGLAPMPNPRLAGRVLATGDVLASYESGITYGWGVATSGSNFWLSNLGVAGGDDLDYEYGSNDGAQTGNTVDESGAIDAWAADGAFNPNTNKFWRVDVVNAGSSCIFEVDPVTHQVTGNTICPNTGTSERGLAYDPVSNSFWTGSWLDGVIFHFDTDGNILDSSFVALEVSGLAYNPNNGHLLVMRNFEGGNDVTVLDALNDYAVLGEFAILDNGSPAITAFGGAGMEFDCLGNLWVIDQNTQTIYNVESGESVNCSVDIPWLTVDPTEGTVPAAAQGAGQGGTNPFPVTVGFDSSGMLPGLRLAQLSISTDSPYLIANVPVALTVLFNDVPEKAFASNFIYGAAGAGVMVGGPPSCPAGVLSFCPDGVVTRADMAGYLWRASQGSLTPPPVYQYPFNDVTFNDYNAFYIQGIFDLGITVGCGGGAYCPNNPNTRAQMSVFLWKAQNGDDLPPGCAGVFADVPCPSQYADYIEAIYSQGITVGCSLNPLNFCPDANITNAQMAVFLVKAFNIPYVP